MLHRDIQTLLPVAALALMTACAGGDPESAGPSQGLDSPDRPVEWAPTELFSVGGFDAPQWAEFGRVAGLGFDADGNLFVLDGQTSTITHISPTGEFVKTIGGAGEGPGELNQPLAMSVLPDGRLAITDIGHRGFVMFDRDGTWLENVSVDLAGEGLPTGDMHPLPGGGLVSSGGIRMSMSSGPGGGRNSVSVSMGGPPEGRPIHRFTLESDVAGSDAFMAWDPPEPPEGGESEMTGGDASNTMQIRMSRLQAFEPGLSFGVLPDGRLVVSDSSAYNLKLVDPTTGMVQSTLGRPISPTVADEGIQQLERDRQLAEAQESSGPRMFTVGGGGGGMSFDQDAMRRMMEDRVESMVFYPEIPIIEALAVDSEGRIWVQRSSNVPGEDGPTDLITADGRYLGTFDPDGMRIPDALGPNGLIAIIETDEFDIPTIKVMRLPGM